MIGEGIGKVFKEAEWFFKNFLGLIRELRFLPAFLSLYYFFWDYFFNFKFF
jgi:hypothetical protein